jgi:photosystem II stability/assembly factor-like uncharacterized protein
MISRILTAIVLAALLAAPAVLAQIGLHPQSLGFGPGWVFDKDSVFCPVSEGGVRRMLQVNPTTKAWKWLNDAEFPAGIHGTVTMRSRNDGVITNVSGSSPFYTTDGWKTVAMGKAGDGIEQIVLTESGYAAHGFRNKGISWSADGQTWTPASEPASAGSGAGTLAGFKNKVVIFSGSSFHLISNDGGKKYAIVDYDRSAFTTYNAVLQFRMFSADSFLLITDRKIYTSTDGGMKWTAGKDLPANSSKVLARGWQDFVLMDGLGKIQFTTDAGATWSVKDGPPDISSYGSMVQIGDELYLWPGWKTKDQGATWTPVFPGFMNGSGIGTAYAIAFNGDFGAIGYSGGKIAYTWDRGRSFTEIDTIPGKQDVMALKILKNNRLLAGDRNGQVFISGDTGRTWTNKLASTSTQNAIKFSVSADEKNMILTRGGQPAGSGDNGEKWDFLPTAGGTLVQTVKPNGTLIGTANMEIATLYLDKPRAKIDSLPSDQGPEDIVALTDDLGWIATRVGTALFGEKETRVYKTTDGFKTSTLMATLDKTATGGNRILAVTPDFLVLYAESRKFFWTSSDGGKTWAKDSLDVQVKFPTTYSLVRRAHFFNPKEQLFIVTASTSGGNTIYLNTGAPGSSGIRPGGARPARQAFYAVFDAGTGRIELRGLGALAADVSLYDVQGRKMLAFRSLPGSRVVPASMLGKGMYFARARLPDGRMLEARFLRH